MESAVDASTEVESDIARKEEIQWTITPLDEHKVTPGAGVSMNETLMTDSGWSEDTASTSNPTLFKSRQRNLSDPICSSSFYDRSVMESTQRSVTDLRYDSCTEDYWRQAQERLVDARLHDREVSRDIERENMHLYLSEMLIAAIEQMKWKRESEAILAAQKLHSEPNSSRSASYTVPDSALPDDMSSSDECPESFANMESCPIRTGESVFYTSVAELEASTSKPSTSRREERKEENDNEESDSESSAEAIASSLLRHFSSMREDEMANDIQWLVSYADAPQMLLPMPTSTVVCDDELDSEGKPIRLRGSTDWAPPRRQWIFTLHPSPQGVWRMLEEQQQRCAGCGIKVNRVYARRMRYCDYYGKWFCQRCHQGARMRTPARLIYQWNFRELPVSDIAHRFLSDNYSQPVINASAVDPNLYRRVGRLRRIRNLRIKLFHLWPFIRACPVTLKTTTKCGNLRSMFTSVPRHILSDVDAYSMSDLENARNGDLIRLIDPLVRYGQCHVEGCERCGSQAFVCELCDRTDELLFPFQTEKVFRCEDCGSLSHLRCAAKHFKQDLPCDKCTRIAINNERHRRHSTNSIAPPEMGRSVTVIE